MCKIRLAALVGEAAYIYALKRLLGLPRGDKSSPSLAVITLRHYQPQKDLFEIRCEKGEGVWVLRGNLGVYRVDTVLRLEVDDQETRRDLTRDVRRVPLALHSGCVALPLPVAAGPEENRRGISSLQSLSLATRYTCSFIPLHDLLGIKKS